MSIIAIIIFYVLVALVAFIYISVMGFGTQVAFSVIGVLALIAIIAIVKKRRDDSKDRDKEQ